MSGPGSPLSRVLFPLPFTPIGALAHTQISESQSVCPGVSRSVGLFLSGECMLLGSLSRHNKNLECHIKAPSAGHSSRVLDRPCYSSQVSTGPCYCS